jgi:hypothetical protein
VLIDETGTTTNMARTRRLALRGKRLVGRVAPTLARRDTVIPHKAAGVH